MVNNMNNNVLEIIRFWFIWFPYEKCFQILTCVKCIKERADVMRVKLQLLKRDALLFYIILHQWSYYMFKEALCEQV